MKPLENPTRNQKNRCQQHIFWRFSENQHKK